MKSAWHRNQHAQSDGIIGFEMEGAGVWDKFNCLVIKGVCDYADSHKSKAWQNYAATAAAAVAKEVLSQYLMPRKVPQPTIPSNREALSYSLLDGSRMLHDSQNSRSEYSLNCIVKGFESCSEKEQLHRDAQKRVLSSLRLPQMQERAQKIEPAYEKTYTWILQARGRQMPSGWHDPVKWLSSSVETRKVYWISGKAGAGKSTLMQFLRDKINEKEHMLPWTQGCSVIRASYFSWCPGNKLQKSVEGLLRSALFQIFEKKPEIIPEVIHDMRWSSAQMSSIDYGHWSNVELVSSLQICIQALQKLSIRVLIFVDGLDEFECTDQMRQELIETFESLADKENVKIFVSSRPWNVFEDSFSDSPKIRLEELTRDDVNSYVRVKFCKSPRFQYLLRSDQQAAENLIYTIAYKAQGVFLWVRLVVQDFLKGIRDGDSIHTLYTKLEEMPVDLEEYFKRLISSIDPQHMREASIILQIALHEETNFANLHPLRLIDLSFIDEPSLDSPLNAPSSHREIFIDDREGLRFRLDSTIRRLNNRCMGLLECTYDPENFLDLFAEDDTKGLARTMHHQGLKFESSIYSEVFDGPNFLHIFMLTVDFLRRCCRDFLLSPQIQKLLQKPLHQYAEGQFDGRTFLVNARIPKCVALQTARVYRRFSIGLASYLVSALSVPKWRETPVSIQAAHTLQPAVEAFAYHDKIHSAYWYISPVLNSWHEDKSNFLTLAIDFDMRGYCMEYLTESQVQAKTGRPILDYILRPRFWSTPRCHLNIGNSAPRVNLLQRVLDLGADANTLYRGISV
ncbi:uncharacterized protein N7483_001594 [Penicillium malachiteum]|uniref:uncharacterized protein n=1 Tax=Penicillium malachiteum TaxID=1324776 RepID=UPI0025488555|nr:uncharacterized protein N7483_001594 [Penicillium malachiteum]KAJ5736469.1 hypothetical protein N7483_001594 [Penicillium malachiteum]